MPAEGPARLGTRPSKDLESWVPGDERSADAAAELNREILDREELYKRAYKGTTSGKEMAPFLGRTQQRIALWGPRLTEMFRDRERLADHRAKGKHSKDWTVDNIGQIGLWSWLAKKGAGLGASALVNSMNLGLVNVEATDVEGGRDTQFQWDFKGWLTSFRKVKAECAEVTATRAVGGEKATRIYNFLKMLSGWFLPLVRTICVGLGMWGVVLAVPTKGASLGVATAAGAVGLVATGLKAIIELALLIWSAIRATQLSDKYSRGEKVARSEATQHGSEFAVDSVIFGTGGLLGSQGGQVVAPEKVLSSRFTEMGTQTPSVQYGSLGYGDGGNILQEGLDDCGLMSRGVGKGISRGGVQLGHQLGMSGSDELSARDGRVKQGKGFDKAYSATQKINSGGNRLASKFASVASNASGVRKRTRRLPPECSN